MKRITAIGKALWELALEEKQQFIHWLWAARDYMSFDHQILGYPRSGMFITQDEDGPTAYLAVQTCIMAEAFVPKPGLSNRRKALSLWRLDEALRTLGKQIGVGDIYMYTTDDIHGDRVAAHGWEEIKDVRLFKRRTGLELKQIQEPSTEGK